jgi:hypothetical protein
VRLFIAVTGRKKTPSDPPIGSGSALSGGVKKPIFKAGSSKNGFIQGTLAPVNNKHEGRFGWGDIVTLIALTIGLLALARVVLTH